MPLLFVVGTYWIFTIIITTAYTSSIIAFITLPEQPVIVDTSYQVVDQGYRVMTLGNCSLIKYFNLLMKNLVKNIQIIF